jgi:hypothetical protein
LIDADIALAQGDGFRAWRSAKGIVLDFAVLRAPGAALGLTAFALLCGLMPALGLSALLPLESANASAFVSLALIGGFAAPFILASIVFLLIAIYLLANSLHAEISAEGIRTERRVFGRITKTGAIAHADIADIEPRISARYQNMFSATPRYALVAKHRNDHSKDVVVAEDVCGQALMSDLRRLIRTTIDIKIT